MRDIFLTFAYIIVVAPILGVVYKIVVYDYFIKLLEEPYNYILGIGIALVLIYGAYLFWIRFFAKVLKVFKF